MKEDLLGEVVPQVIDPGEFFQGAEASAEGLLLHDNVDQSVDASNEAFGPAHFLALADVITADVLKVGEHGSCFFDGFPSGGIDGRLERLNSTRWDAPAAIGDVADEYLAVLPGEDKRGKSPDRWAIGGRKELELLSSVLSAWEAFYRHTSTLPITRSSLIGPKERLSSL